MNENICPSTASLPAEVGESRFDVRSVTGASYTLVEEREMRDGAVHRSYRTAYARLEVVSNADGSFTIVDTRTRLVRVDPR